MYVQSIDTETRWRPRAYAGPHDLVRMQELQRDGWRRLGPVSESHPGDLEWWMNGNTDPGTDWSRRIALWETPRGDLRGWSWLYGQTLEWYVHPQETDTALRHAQLGWYEQMAMAAEAPSTEPRVLSTWSTTRQPELGRLLAGAGYDLSIDHLIHSAIDLPRGRASSARTPEGYTIRSVVGALDIPRRVAVHRSAFEPSRMTAERYAQVMQAPSYRPELDVVAVAADGAFAAFCLVWYDADLRVGLLEPVGTDQAHRRRGLAAAVCAEALRRLEQLGAERASVLSKADREGPNRLYRSLGFREVMRSMQWRRTPAPSDDGTAA
jgi:ribosomal protein S18 acetylase RimI-like enzyme